MRPASSLTLVCTTLIKGASLCSNTKPTSTLTGSWALTKTWTSFSPKLASTTTPSQNTKKPDSCLMTMSPTMSLLHQSAKNLWNYMAQPLNSWKNGGLLLTTTLMVAFPLMISGLPLQKPKTLLCLFASKTSMTPNSRLTRKPSPTCVKKSSKTKSFRSRTHKENLRNFSKTK